MKNRETNVKKTNQEKNAKYKSLRTGDKKLKGPDRPST